MRVKRFLVSSPVRNGASVVAWGAAKNSPPFLVFSYSDVSVGADVSISVGMPVYDGSYFGPAAFVLLLPSPGLLSYLLSILSIISFTTSLLTSELLLSLRS